MQGLKVLVGGALVVPPFECAWLTGEDLTFASGSGCICFEAKADTDVTVILKATPGSRRWQPLQRAAAAAQQQQQPEPNYTVIFGSHRNSCLKFEKSGGTRCMVRGVPGSRVSGKEFQRFWVHYASGAIAVGTGEPSLETLSYRWRDDDPSGPIPGVRHVGLSCWDRHACYRAIRMHPRPLSFPDSLVGHAPGLGLGVDLCSPDAASASAVPPLLALCCRAAEAGLLGPGSVCSALWAAELLLPSTRRLYAACLISLAKNLQEVHRSDPSGWAQLSPACLVDLLQQNDIPLGEKVIFDIVEQWAQGYQAASARERHAHNHEQQLAVEDPRGEGCGQAVEVEMAVDGAAPSGSGGDTGCSCSGASARGEEVVGGSSSDNAGDAQTALGLDLGPTAAADGAGTSLPTAVAGSGGLPHAGDVMMSASTSAAWAASCHDEAVHADVCMVLAMIRYPLMTSQELYAVRACPLAQSSPDVLTLVDEAMGLPVLPPPSHKGQGQGREEAGEATVAVDGSLLQLLGPGSAGQQQQQGLQTQQRKAFSDHGSGSRGEDGGNGNGSGVGGNGLQPAASMGDGVAAPAPGSLFCVENKRLLRSSLEGQQHQMQLLHPCRYQRRCLPTAKELSYVCDGDENGVLRHIGTLYGAQEWVNPVLTKRVDIKASSPTGRLTDPKALAGDHFVRHNFAGPRYMNGRAETWWCVDLGANHQLLVNYYTMRHDGCTDYPRHWVLQGSADLSAWVDLRRHVNDASLRKPGQYASWAVLGPAASTPYRAFRLLLEGPTTSATSPHTFCLSNLELYGYLTRLDAAPPAVQAGAVQGSLPPSAARIAGSCVVEALVEGVAEGVEGAAA